MRTPEVPHVSEALLALRRQWAQRDGEFFRRWGSMVAALHTSTVSDRFGGERHGWRDRTCLLFPRELLSTLAHDDDVRGLRGRPGGHPPLLDPLLAGAS
ncbi:hypothetical protein [Streptomyces sedi]|uniref:Uncharacterized protein n=1 Tax=Streptomyces sedi TaxID=555059 RepID=A0A5C4UW48_9ACTN|nr:hypothetical protein [Streptomyces sedi]TNM27758.1 hypothetical protein FH715_20355 [Streptomyces sedi]